MRRNGPYALYMTVSAGAKLPFGNLPRLLLAWMCPSQHLVKPFSILSCKIGVFSCSSSNCSNSSPAPKIHPRQNGRAAGI